MRIYFLRHGESEGNREKRFRGRTDYPLTSKGLKQAENAGRYLKDTDFEIIYSSPLKRARQTAEKVTDILGADYQVNYAFNNIELGQWEGRKQPAIKEQYPGKWRTWITNPRELHIKGMENIKDIEKRVITGIETIRSRHSGNVLIITHRTIIKIAVAALARMEVPAFWKIRINTAGLVILEWKEPTGWIINNLNINHYLSDNDKDDN